MTVLELLSHKLNKSCNRFDMANIVLLSLICLTPVLFAIIWKLMEGGSNSTAGNIHRQKCEKGQFSLPGMQQCHPLLDCKQISQQITVKEVIGQGAVKVVKRGEWRDYNVAVNILANSDYREDFHQGLYNLRLLQLNVSVTQLVGECESQDVFITEFYPLGSADRLEQILKTDGFHSFNSPSFMFGLCRQYVSILYSLHSGADGARVMCDSNDINKTLSQFLLAEDLSLVLNDVDALPLANKDQGQLIKCGHRELFGDFVAPEQLWPYEDGDFNDTEMPGYDEKVDIWRIPDVCEAFLAHTDSSANMVILRLRLRSYHFYCKQLDPSERPSASDMVKSYEELRKLLSL